VTGWSSYTPRLRVHSPSPPTTRRATVEVFEPASTRGLHIVTCRRVHVTDTVSSRCDWLDLLGVSVIISLDYNSSHI
jgi:cellulase/cellobiase CelA1